MIALNETDPTAAEIPFFLPLSSDPLGATGLTGHVFTLGEVQLRLPGGSFGNATVANIVEKGFGRYCVQLQSSQTMMAGLAYVQATVSGAQPYTGTEQIGVFGGDIPLGAGGSIPFFLPNALDPVFGAPVTGHVFVTGEVQFCLPGGAYANATVGNISEIGDGAYELALTPAQAARRGKAFIYVLVSGAQRYEGYATILNPGTSTSSTTTAVGAAPATVTFASSALDHVASALGRLPAQFIEGF